MILPALPLCPNDKSVLREKLLSNSPESDQVLSRHCGECEYSEILHIPRPIESDEVVVNDLVREALENTAGK